MMNSNKHDVPSLDLQAICKNCRYFVQVGTGPSHIWGDCMKPLKPAFGANSDNKAGTFTWADRTCSDFAPREIPHSAMKSGKSLYSYSKSLEKKGGKDGAK